MSRYNDEGIRAIEVDQVLDAEHDTGGVSRTPQATRPHQRWLEKRVCQFFVNRISNDDRSRHLKSDPGPAGGRDAKVTRRRGCNCAFAPHAKGVKIKEAVYPSRGTNPQLQGVIMSNSESGQPLFVEQRSREPSQKLTIDGNRGPVMDL